MIARLHAVAVVLLATAGVLAWLARPEAAPSRLPLPVLASAIDGWTGRDLPLDPKVLRVLGVDDHVSRVYVSPDGTEAASLYIGYYASQRTGETIHSPMKCLPGTGWQPLQTGVTDVLVPAANGAGDRSIRVNRYVVQKGAQQHVVLFWYQMRDDVITSEYVAKLAMVRNAVAANRTDGALVRVIVPVSEGADPGAADRTAAAFVRSLFPRLAAHLPA